MIYLMYRCSIRARKTIRLFYCGTVSAATPLAFSDVVRKCIFKGKLSNETCIASDSHLIKQHSFINSNFRKRSTYP